MSKRVLDEKTQFPSSSNPEFKIIEAAMMEAEADRWFKMAWKGNIECQFQIANCLEHGFHGIRRDIAQAVMFYKSAAAHNHAEAQYSLFLCFRSGTGVPQDMKQQLHWLQESAKNKLAQAQYILGDYYERGKPGLVADIQEAIKWYKLAAAQGDLRAEKSLNRLGITTSSLHQSTYTLMPQPSTQSLSMSDVSPEKSQDVDKQSSHGL